MASPAQRIRREHRVLVFNPTDFSDEVEAGGNFYHFEPRAVGTCNCSHHNQPGQLDNVGVHAAYDYARDDKNRIIWNQRAQIPTGDAQTIADFICSPSHRGDKGYVVLEGTAQEQETAKSEAMAKWREYFIVQAERIIMDWEAFVASYALTRPGDPPPKQPKNVTHAYLWRRKNRQANEDRLPFICRSCSADFPSKEVLDAHITEEHPAAAATSALPIQVRPAAEVPADELPVHEAPRPAPGQGVAARLEGRAQELEARATKAGVVLTVADRKGLAHADQEVLADILGRIRAGEVPPPAPVAAAAPAVPEANTERPPDEDDDDEDDDEDNPTAAPAAAAPARKKRKRR
jgi:hypothetical protein